MSNNYKGTVNVSGQILVQGKMAGLKVSLDSQPDVYSADTNGHVDLPIVTQEDTDVIFQQFPISQYGDINKEVGVAGTYDGGSTVRYYSSMPVLLENDGSLVYLRPGTNGNTINYYYTYVQKPDSVDITPQSTIRKYYEGNSKNIVFYDSYTKDTLLYEDIDNQIMHVVLTNGTMEKNAHQEATFPKTSMPYQIITGLKVDDYVYVICLYNTSYNTTNPISYLWNNNDPSQFLFFRIPVTQIQSGTITTVEQVTGISGTTMYGDVVSGSSTVKIADALASTSSSSTKSFIKYPDVLEGRVAPWTYTLIGVGKSYYDGTNIIFSFYVNGYSINDTQRTDMMYGYTITYNVSAKTYTHDLSNIPITCTGGLTGTLTWNNPYAITAAKISGYNPTSYTDGNSSSWYITDNGVQYSVKEKYVLSDYYVVTRSVLSGFTNKANAYKIRNRTLSNVVYKEVFGDYASRVGDQLCGGSPISPSRIMFTGTGSYQGTNYGKYARGISDIGTSRTYSYTSLNNGTISGYAPQAYRVPFGNDNESKMVSKISLHDSSTGTVNAYGTAFIEGFQNTSGYKLDPNTITYDTTYSCSDTVLQNVKNQIISNLGLTATSSLIGIYYVPDSSYCKSIACVTTVNSGNGGNTIAATIDCTLSGNVITSISLNTIFFNTYKSDIQNLPPTIAEVYPKSGLSCVKYGDFTYISFSHLAQVSVVGDLFEWSICGKVSLNTVSSVLATRSYHVSGVIDGSREYSYLPNYGFGYYTYSSVTDIGTKLVFYYAGNTSANFDTLFSGSEPTTKVAVIAQDVIVGFYLYFTEITPVFIAGQYHELPITTIDLNTITANPASKKYYVYVQYNNGTVSYVVSLVEIAESATNMFIGSFLTDTTKVSELDINMVSRFDLYRPSTTQIGSAFPVSTGFPSSTGTINW